MHTDIGFLKSKFKTVHENAHSKKMGTLLVQYGLIVRLGLETSVMV